MSWIFGGLFTIIVLFCFFWPYYKDIQKNQFIQFLLKHPKLNDIDLESTFYLFFLSPNKKKENFEEFVIYASN